MPRGRDMPRGASIVGRPVLFPVLRLAAGDTGWASDRLRAVRTEAARDEPR